MNAEMTNAILFDDAALLQAIESSSRNTARILKTDCDCSHYTGTDDENDLDSTESTRAAV